MAIWNPWKGCHKCSEGCKFCYIHKGNYKRGIDTNIITKSEKFDYPLIKNKKGEYKIKPGSLVYLSFASDFLLEEGDEYRIMCWEIIKERKDLDFIFLTKRIERFLEAIPKDWEDGYDNVTVGVSIENQKNADFRLNILKDLPIKHKNIICQPLIEDINIEKYLNNIKLVVVGGESDYKARSLNYDWVLNIRRQCIKNEVSFEFRQLGTHFIKDGKSYTIPTNKLISQAKKANIDYYFDN